MVRTPAAGMRDKGSRAFQEDAFLVAAADGLFVVADAMGPMISGLPAAELALEVIADRVKAGASLAAALEAANGRIFERCEAARQRREGVDPRWHGMAAVVVAALVRDGYAMIAHVGDARAYLVRSGALVRLTTDHSLVRDHRKLGVAEELLPLPEGVVTRALGFAAEVEVETRLVALMPGDALVLASDGLGKVVGDEEIAATVDRAGEDLEGACAALVRRAVALGEERGGSAADNVTVVVVRPEITTTASEPEARALVAAIADAPWGEVRDAYGPAVPAGAALVELSRATGEDLADAFEDLLGRLAHQGTVYPASALAVPYLVDVAEAGTELRAAAALALLLAIGAGEGEGEVARRIDEALASAAPRLEALGARGDARASVARHAARRARGEGERSAGVEQVLAEVEGWLDREAAEDVDEQSVTNLDAALRALRITDDESELAAVRLVVSCWDADRPHDVLALSARLGSRRLLAEPYRIRALARLGRGAEATAAAITLAEAWLAPASSIESTSQVLLRSDVLRALREVREATRAADLDAWIARVSVAVPEVFIPEGDFF